MGMHLFLSELVYWSISLPLNADFTGLENRVSILHGEFLCFPLPMFKILTVLDQCLRRKCLKLNCSPRQNEFAGFCSFPTEDYMSVTTSLIQQKDAS